MSANRTTLKETRSLISLCAAWFDAHGEGNEAADLGEACDAWLEESSLNADLEHAKSAGLAQVYRHDLVVKLANGGFIATDGNIHRFGAAIYVYDARGKEQVMWTCEEVGENPELVVGAVLAAAAIADGQRSDDD